MQDKDVSPGVTTTDAGKQQNYSFGDATPFASRSGNVKENIAPPDKTIEVHFPWYVSQILDGRKCDCGGSLHFRGDTQHGKHCAVHASCNSCKKMWHFHSMPSDRVPLADHRDTSNLKKTMGFQQVHFKEVAASLLSQQTEAGYRRGCYLKGLIPLCHETYRKISNVIFSLLTEIAEEEMNKHKEMITKRGSTVLVCDAGWSHRGWVANQGWLPVVDFETNKIIKVYVKHKTRNSSVKKKGSDGKTQYVPCVVHVGNYEGSSGGMEGSAVQELIDWLDEEGLLGDASGNTELDDDVNCRESSTVIGICIDKDTTNNQIWRDDKRSKYLLIYYDPGHSKKNFQKSLEGIVGSAAGVKGLPARIAGRFMNLIKQAELLYPGNTDAMKTWFNDRWAYTMDHISDEACVSGCPCVYAGKSKQEKGASQKYWLPKNHKNRAGVNYYDKIQELVLKIGQRSDEYIHGYNTCFGESLHRQRTVWTNKDIEYWSTFEGRCYLTVCWNHLGPSTSLRLYEAAGMKISDTMRAGVQEQQREWENRAARRATEEAQKRKATNKQERRSARAEAAKISKKKNHIYNQQHTFDFSETAPVGSEEGKSGKKSGPGSVSQARRKEIMLSGTDEEKNCFWQCGDCQKVYCKKNGKSGLEAHKLKCKHPGNITIGSDDEEAHVEDQTKNTSPPRDNGS
jgi:hypothetical protein